MPEFFRAAFAHHGTASRATHLGPVHAWLHDSLGLSQGAGTAVISVVFVLIVLALIGAGFRKVFG